MTECDIETEQGHDVSKPMPVPKSQVWGQYGDRWFMCTVLEVKDASTIFVKWHYDGSEAR